MTFQRPPDDSSLIPLSLFEAEKRSGFHDSILFLRSGASGSLFDLMESHPSLSKKSLDLISLGSVYLNHCRETNPHIEIKPGDLLRVHQEPRRYPIPFGEKNIVFENDEFLVIDKPSLLPTHATVDNLKENALSILQTLRPEVYVLNRLDLETRGLLVFAKTKIFHREFQELLKTRRIEKIYRATAEGEVQLSGLLTHHMVKSFRSPKVLFRDPRADTQICQLEILQCTYSPLDDSSDITLRLITGRSHQIRAQMAFEGHPLRGDTAYGSKRPYPFSLICEELSWMDSNGRTQHFRINSTNTLNTYS